MGHFIPTELQVTIDMEGKFVYREIGPGVLMKLMKLMKSGELTLFASEKAIQIFLPWS